MTDSIRLTIPANERFRDVATMVLGGVGTRLDLSYERMDDLQLAASSALVAASGEIVTMEVEVSEASVSVGIGPLVSGSSTDRGLLLVLERLVDSVTTTERDGGEWLVLELVRAPAPVD
ncbi:MAG TPA: hypothetical protein VFK76_08725 [Gaiellaceae bacterium]|nr:hypothetical protein [Gaiellaceae bacterium]